MIRKSLSALVAVVLTASIAVAVGSMNSLCYTTNGSNCVPVDSSNPLPVTGSAGGTQNVNLTQILGAVPSLTNPLWIIPATGASFAVTVAAPPLQSLGITPTDRTIASASGASQQIMAANASRHSLTIENTGSANCGVNPTGGTAVIGGAGTLTVAPLGSYTPRIPTLSAVTVICTAAQPIYADEN